MGYLYLVLWQTGRQLVALPPGLYHHLHRASLPRSARDSAVKTERDTAITVTNKITYNVSPLLAMPWTPFRVWCLRERAQLFRLVSQSTSSVRQKNDVGVLLG